MNDDALTPRKLPKQLRSRETVDAIFTAAMQLLDRNDVKDPSVQTIADRAGVSVGSLYQYFPSKESLVSALLRFHLEQQLTGLEKSLEETQGLPAEIAAERLIDGLIGAKQSRLKIERALIRFFCRVGDLFTLTEFDDRINAVVERFILSLGAQVRPLANPSIAAFLVMNALRSAVLMSLVQRPEQLRAPEFKAELVKLVVSYLKPESGRAGEPIQIPS